MMSQLSGLATLLQNIIINTEKATDQTYSGSITQLRTLLGLPWDQQVRAIEDAAFELEFLEKFQSFWFENILSQQSPAEVSLAEGEDQDETQVLKTFWTSTLISGPELRRNQRRKITIITMIVMTPSSMMTLRKTLMIQVIL